MGIRRSAGFDGAILGGLPPFRRTEKHAAGEKTMTTIETSIDPADVARLARDVAGPVVVPGDERFAEECATWNQALIHHPVVAVGATATADVQAAVRFANAHNLPVAVVATGHGACIADDGAVLINLRRMNGIVI